MKRIVLTIFLMSLGFFMSGQNNVFPRLEKTRTDILKFFFENKLSPQTEDSGIISFVSEEHDYILECSEESDDLIFVKLSEVFPYDSIITPGRIRRFSEEFNYKTVKVLCGDSKYTVRSEFMFDEVALFKMIFPRVVKNMSRAEVTLRTKCISYAKEPSVLFTGIEPVFVYSDSLKSLEINAKYESCGIQKDSISTNVRIYKNNTLILNTTYNDEPYTLSQRVSLSNSGGIINIGSIVIDESFLDTPMRIELWNKCEFLLSKSVSYSVKD